jgi:hypothetical protein
LSNKIPNEFIGLLPTRIQTHIIPEIEIAICHPLLFDYSLDIAHLDLTSQIIFYDNIIDGRFFKKESFMDLIHAHERTDRGLAP